MFDVQQCYPNTGHMLHVLSLFPAAIPLATLTSHFDSRDLLSYTANVAFNANRIGPKR